MSAHPMISETPDLDHLLKFNALKLADEHRAICNAPDCDVRLSLLGELLRRAGIELSDGDWQRLL